MHDITPITTAVTLANCFGTSSGSTRVCCSDANHGRKVGDYVYFTSTATFNAVSLSTNVYPITSVDSANIFTITVTTAANATASDVGSATFNYYIPTGYSIAAAGMGYGAATFLAVAPTSVGISKISTTGSNTLVTVSCAAAHNGVANDSVYFKPSSVAVVPVTVGGNLILTKPSLNGVAIGGPSFTIVSVNGTQLIFNVETAASATENATSGLNITALIYPQTGGSAPVTIRAWSQPASAGSSGIIFDITQWSLDNWGEDVVANRSGSNIFIFDTNASTSPIRATSIATSPVSVNSILVSPNDRHLIAFGTNRWEATATVSGTFNPLLVRWSDQDDPTEWNPTAATTAGEVVLTDGTKIIGAKRSKNAINIWTDNSLWTMSHVGPPFTFRFNQAGTNCGMVGPHAGIDFNGVTYWMGFGNFHRFSGQVETLDCTVRRYIFDDINPNYYTKVYVGINSEFNEIIWLYPSGTGTECDKYVIYNPVDKYWVYGTMFFTTFADKEIFGNTITTGVTAAGNNVYNNEPVSVFVGSNNETLTSFIESADFGIGEGNSLMFMDRVIPDYEMVNGGKIRMKITTQQYPESPSDNQIVKEFDITETTQKV